MKYLVRLEGDAEVVSNVDIHLNLPRKYLDYKEQSVDLEAVREDGFDGLLYLDAFFCDSHISFGGSISWEPSVDIRKQFKWQPVEVKCNVPVNIYCKRGFFKSLYEVFRRWRYKIIVFENGGFCFKRIGWVRK